MFYEAGTLADRLNEAVEAERERVGDILRVAIRAGLQCADDNAVSALRSCRKAILDSDGEPSPRAEEPMTIPKLTEKVMSGSYDWSNVADLKNALQALVDVQAWRDAKIAADNGYGFLADKIKNSAGLRAKPRSL